MTLSILNDICNCWWLYWLLPFLLGLLLGWLLWSKYKKYISLYESTKRDLDTANAKIAKLEDDLRKCRLGRSDLDSQIALLKGQLKEANGKVTRMDIATPKVHTESIVSNVAANPVEKEVSTTNEITPPAISMDKFAALKEDNLQIVEGIGPKMNEVLNNSGVNTWSQLAAKSATDLRATLDTYSDKYRIIDPSTWSDQAKLATEGKWQELIDLQKQLDTGKVGAVGLTDSKLEKIMIKLKILKRWSQDDLKAIEGIGPKIEELLHNDGIKTWKQLSEAPISRLQKILDDAGKRFQLADPKTWAQQAGLAHEGRWDELEALQDSLNGGK